MKIRMAAGLLVTHQFGPEQCLLVKPSYKDHWEIPGGVVEPGELPAETAEREAKEEIGLVRPAGRLLVVQTIVAADKSTCLVAYVFDGGSLARGNGLAVDGQEIVDWAWCDGYSRMNVFATAPLLGQRVTAAIDAQRTGRTFHLEHRAEA